MESAISGKIVKINSDIFTVKVGSNYIDCKSRGKFRNIKLKPLVGDNVLINEKERIIEEVLERKNVLLRPPVANIDLALIVTSIKKPDISLNLLDKLISIITINNIEPMIIFTKMDLASKEEIKDIDILYNYYNKVGIKALYNTEIDEIKRVLKNKTITVCGQTGAGKSSLINKLDNSLNLETKEISNALGRGVHTTRIVSLYDIDDFYIVDTPGFSAIDINRYSKEEIKNSFIEFRNIVCKFSDCIHDKEVGCEVIEEVKNGTILQSRYDNYIRFIKESK